MSEFAKLSIQSLNALFSHLAEDTQKVFWVRDKGFKKQLFLSQSYETICKRSREELYTHPTRWDDFLIGEYSDEFAQLLKSRTPQQTEQQQSNAVLYRLRDANEQTLWMKDTHFYLLNGEGQQIGVAGLAEPISESQWLAEIQNYKSNQNPSKDKQDFISILKKELKLTATPSNYAILLDQEKKFSRYLTLKNGEKIFLSSREIECLHYLLKGYSAKEIAKKLLISYRTVELHIAHIKEKTQCRTLLKLISSIREFLL